jgi:hypothetical protein
MSRAVGILLAASVLQDVDPASDAVRNVDQFVLVDVDVVDLRSGLAGGGGGTKDPTSSGWSWLLMSVTRRPPLNQVEKISVSLWNPLA